MIEKNSTIKSWWPQNYDVSNNFFRFYKLIKFHEDLTRNQNYKGERKNFGIFRSVHRFIGWLLYIIWIFKIYHLNLHTDDFYRASFMHHQVLEWQPNSSIEYILKPQPNEHNISFNIIQLWFCMKCCTCWPLCCIVLYHIVSCCMKFVRDQTFSLNKCCTIQHFFCFWDVVWCCTRLAIPCNFVVLCCTRACAIKAVFPPQSFVH